MNFRQTLVNQHGGVSQKEIIAGKNGQLQRVLHSAGPGSKPGGSEAAHASIILGNGIMNAVEVETARGSEHVELLGDCEIQITPTVREQLRQFGL